MKIEEKLIHLSGENHDEEIVAYGIGILRDGVVTMITIMAIGTACGRIWESAIYLLFSMLGTSIMGAYHCRTRIRCLLCTILCWIAMVISTDVVDGVLGNVSIIGISILLLAIVGILAPAEHENKPLTPLSYKKNKIISIYFNIFIVLLIFCSIMLYRKLAIVLLINQIEIVMSMIIGKGVCRYAKEKHC